MVKIIFKNTVNNDNVLKNKYLLSDFKPNLKRFFISMIIINLILIIIISLLKDINAKIIEDVFYINIGALTITFLIDIIFKKVNTYEKYRYLIGNFSCYIENDILYSVSENRELYLQLPFSTLHYNKNYSIIINNEDFKILLINNHDEDYEKLINVITKRVQGVNKI